MQMKIEPAWLRDKDLAHRFCVSRITIWRWVKEGRLPAPRKLSPNTTRWSAEEIRQHEKEVLR